MTKLTLKVVDVLDGVEITVIIKKMLASDVITRTAELKHKSNCPKDYLVMSGYCPAGNGKVFADTDGDYAKQPSYVVN